MNDERSSAGMVDGEGRNKGMNRGVKNEWAFSSNEHSGI
jgi:hypothetical protein